MVKIHCHIFLNVLCNDAVKLMAFVLGEVISVEDRCHYTKTWENTCFYATLFILILSSYNSGIYAVNLLSYVRASLSGHLN